MVARKAEPKTANDRSPVITGARISVVSIVDYQPGKMWGEEAKVSTSSSESSHGKRAALSPPASRGSDKCSVPSRKTSKHPGTRQPDSPRSAIALHCIVHVLCITFPRDSTYVPTCILCSTVRRSRRMPVVSSCSIAIDTHD